MAKVTGSDGNPAYVFDVGANIAGVVSVSPQVTPNHSNHVNKRTRLMSERAYAALGVCSAGACPAAYATFGLCIWSGLIYV